MGRVNKRPQRVVIHEIDANVTEMRVANDYWVLEIVSSAYFFFFLNSEQLYELEKFSSPTFGDEGI